MMWFLIFKENIITEIYIKRYTKKIFYDITLYILSGKKKHEKNVSIYICI